MDYDTNLRENEFLSLIQVFSSDAKRKKNHAEKIKERIEKISTAITLFYRAYISDIMNTSQELS